MVRVQVKPELIEWAVARAGARAGYLREKFDLAAWEGGQNPTMRQLEQFATAARVPIGYLFLENPPAEQLPIPDLRTPGNQGLPKASPDLMETISICMQRQEWYREYAENAGYGALDFVGSVKLSDAPSAVAAVMQSRLRFGINERRAASGIDDTIRIFIESAERLGVLVMVSGIVGSNTQRVLDCDEFQGFALTDRVAPLVFVNGADWKAAQVFTLAHELAHVWLGSSALSNATPDRIQNETIEIWCNAVAAELLVPTAELRAAMVTANPINEVPNLSYAFRVSTLVILRRLKDTGLITTEQFWRAYKSEAESFQSQSRAKGGNYYQTQPYRVSRKFARAIIASASEGSTLYRDAFRLLGVKKDATFRELGKKLKVLP